MRSSILHEVCINCFMQFNDFGPFYSVVCSDNNYGKAIIVYVYAKVQCISIEHVYTFVFTT